jgi:dihydroorotase
MKLEIRHGRVIDPQSARDGVHTLFCAAGRIVSFDDAPADWTHPKVIDASGLVVCPGLIDLAARVGNPGAKGGIHFESELRAAAAGGVTGLALAPDTSPVLDEPGLVEMLAARAHSLHLSHVYPLGALTSKLAGENLSELAALHQAGCVGFSQAERAIGNTQVLYRAMQYAASCGFTVHLRPRDAFLGADGVMHEGEVATRLGLPSVPAVAELIAVSQLIALAQATGCRLHLCRISSAQSVAEIARAKSSGVNLTCDVSAAHLHLTDVDVGYFDSQFHLQPPLRSGADRDALRAGLASGVIDAVVSDHTPLSAEAKQTPFAESAPGCSAIETLLPLVLKWSGQDNVPLAKALGKITHHAAKILGVPGGALALGAAADLCVFDPNAHRVLTGARLASAGKNSPFLGYEMQGIVRTTIVGGRVVYEAPSKA